MLGSTEGVHFFKIENDGLQQVDFVEGNFSSTQVVHRDIKTFQHYAYAVCDEGPSMLQIIDLSYLPDSVHVVAEIDVNFGRVHNLFIDEANALMYACRVTPIVNGNPTAVIPMRVFSLADPINPQLLYQGPTGVIEVHDCYAKDNIAILNCGYDGFRVYDFSNPSSPQFLQNTEFYQDQGFNHQGWLTPDGKTYIFGDETNGKRLKKCAVDENHQLTINNTFGTNYQNNSVAHNIMLTNEFAFVAYYLEGLRIYDIRSFPVEIAHYDTYLAESTYKLKGAWGIYSNLPSERLLISDTENGLFLFDFDRSKFTTRPDDVVVYPSLLGSNQEITVQINGELSTNFDVSLFDLNGKKLITQSFINQTYGTINLNLAAGLYHVTIRYVDYLGDEQVVVRKIVVG